MSEPKFITISDRTVPLKEAQEFVGGWVEAVTKNDDTVYLVNEEGLLEGLPFNKTASEDAGRNFVGNVMKLTGIAKRTF